MLIKNVDYVEYKFTKCYVKKSVNIICRTTNIVK